MLNVSVLTLQKDVIVCYFAKVVASQEFSFQCMKNSYKVRKGALQLSV